VGARRTVTRCRLMNHKGRVRERCVRIHGIVDGAGIRRFPASFWMMRPASERNGQWAPYSTSDIRGAVRLSVLIVTQPASQLHLPMELEKSYRLPGLSAEGSEAQDQNHGFALVVESSAFAVWSGKFRSRAKDCPWNDVSAI